ncbi:MAG TPA: tetratricopeptide repeat protein [Methylomirabilota bacterium]|nr:tetratricopeptide repeat protein [Methylomirabilota bacterium]
MAEPLQTSETDSVLASSIRRYEARFAKDPTSLAFAPLADLYRKAGRHQEAIALCREGLARYPRYETARLILAKALLANGDPDGAEAEFKAMVALAPDNVQAHQALADIYRSSGNLEKALYHLEQVLALDRGNKEARALLEAFTNTPGEGSTAPLARLLADDTFITMTFGTICLRQGCVDEAITVFARILRKDPRHAEARRRLDDALSMKAQRRR